MKSNSAFDSDNSESDHDETNLENVDWQTLLPKNKEKYQEEPNQKSERLYQEGITLAEEERYWEAISRWDQALEITPLNEKLYEMKSQVLMELGEIHPALESAEKSAKIKPIWAEAFQTLGRAQLNVGEIHLALKSFARAKHLNPSNPELWDEDIEWARTLIERKEMEADDEVEMEIDEAEMVESSSP